MKKILFPLLYLSIASVLICSCKKESAISNNGNGSVLALRTAGFLCTMGISHSGSEDTIVYNPWGGGPVAGYGAGYQDAADELFLTNNSNGSVTLQRRIPYTSSSRSYTYFGYEINTSPDFSSFPQNDYLFNLSEVESPETQFIIKRDSDDKNKFSLECKAYPGYYLGTAKWRNAVYPDETELVVTGAEQFFFFLVD